MVVFGVISGLCIWFAIGPIKPSAASTLIHSKLLPHALKTLTADQGRTYENLADKGWL